jgi:hypothetical protein
MSWKVTLRTHLKRPITANCRINPVTGSLDILRYVANVAVEAINEFKEHVDSVSKQILHCKPKQNGHWFERADA